MTRLSREGVAPLFAGALALLGACSSGLLVGETDRASLFAADPRFEEQRARATVDRAAVDEISRAAPGAHLEVFLGAWCSDSRHEMGTFAALLDALGDRAPFTTRYVAVDRAKHAGALTDERNIRFVPTFIVMRDGVEVGRIVEHAPDGLERTLAQLLDGRRSGIASTRRDLE